MELIFGLAALYPVFLATLHVPMFVAYFALKRRRLLRPWHFIVTCATVFGLGHALALAVVIQDWPGVLVPISGVALGAACGLVWWYILVKRIGVDGHHSGKVGAT
jgi:hypothetical protein